MHSIYVTTLRNMPVWLKSFCSMLKNSNRRLVKFEACGCNFAADEPKIDVQFLVRDLSVWFSCEVELHEIVFELESFTVHCNLGLYY